MPERKSTTTRRKFTVHVTQEDIDGAIRNASRHCAVASAIKREIPGVYRQMVDIQTVRFSLPEEKTRYVYLTPPEIQDYIVAFDAGDPIHPFEFTLFRLGWHGPIVSGTGDKPRSHQKNIVYTASINAPRDEGSTQVDVPIDIPLPLREGASYKLAGPPSSVRDREYGIRRMRRNQTARKGEQTQ